MRLKIADNPAGKLQSPKFTRDMFGISASALDEEKKKKRYSKAKRGLTVLLLCKDLQARTVDSGGGNGGSGRGLPFLLPTRSSSEWPACGFVMEIEERDRGAFGRRIGLPSISVKL